MLKSAKERFTTMTYESDNGYTGIMYGRSSVRVIDQRTGKEVYTSGSRESDSYLWLVDLVDHFEEYRRAILSMAGWDEDDNTTN